MKYLFHTRTCVWAFHLLKNFETNWCPQKYFSMMDLANLLDLLKQYGVGRRALTDELFSQDKPPARLGVYDLDDENLCHEVIKTTCSVPGCLFTAESLLDSERHYNAWHRYSCGQCRRALPSPHLLDLHLQEEHDSFFAVMAEKKPSYCCYIEECKEKFLTADERFEHCVKVHKLPKDFRFEQKHKKAKNAKAKKQRDNTKMDVDQTVKESEFSFTNSKQKGFVKYKGKKFTNNEGERAPKDVNMDDIVEDLKFSLPE